MNKSLTLLAAALTGAVAAHAPAAVIPIVADTAVGSAGGGGFFDGATDAQPATDPVAGPIATYAAGAGFGFAGSDTRAAYIDFGVDFANVRINQVLLLLKRFGDNPHAQDNYWWGDNDDDFEAGEFAAPDFNVLDVPGNPTSAQQWVSVWSSATPETPKARYLIVQRVANAANIGGNRNLELAFLTVPEPASLGLLATGAGLMLLRRRA